MSYIFLEDQSNTTELPNLVNLFAYITCNASLPEAYASSNLSWYQSQLPLQHPNLVMASSSSAATAAFALIPIADKLHRGNYLVWRAQALATIRGAQLIDHLNLDHPFPEPKLADKDGKPTDVPNPAYVVTLAQDSQVLSFIFNSISPPVMIQVAHCTKAAAAWTAIGEMFLSQT